MAFIFYLVIFLGIFLFLVWKKKKFDTESYFHLKIIGYFVLGSFSISFNQLTIPIGFLGFLFFFRPKLNAHAKRMSTYLGVIALILNHWILPYSINKWESRPIIIEHKLASVYTINLQDEYKLIKKELKLKNTSLMLEDYEVNYVKNGRITDLRWQLIEQNGNGFNLYHIQYDSRKNRYQVIKSPLDTWLQYSRLVDADRFFEILNVLNIKDTTHSKGEFSSYVIKTLGERVRYEVKNQDLYIVSNEKIQLLDDEQLPVEGFYISTFAMKKTSEERDKQGNITGESFEGTEISDYLFDVNIIE
ncbi:hypothetical protein V7056_18700 [Bacillus sp. JJ664]